MTSPASAWRWRAVGGRFAVLLGMLAPTACGGAAAPEAPTATPAQARPTLTAAVAELAERLDPGPQRRMHEALPEWLLAPLGLDRPLRQDETALAQIARESFASWQRLDSADSDDALVEKLLALGKAIVSAELAADAHSPPRVEMLLILAELYGELDAPRYQNRTGWSGFRQLLERLFSAGGQSPDADEVERLFTTLFDELERARTLHRRAAAQLLRQAPTHPAIPDVLDRLARTIERSNEAATVARLAVRLRGDRANAQHWADLARACFKALDVACGQHALDRAAKRMASRGETVADMDAVRRHGRHARRAVSLGDRTGLEAELTRARALEGLERRDDARAMFVALRRRFPSDPRPIIGLARLAMDGAFDFREAARLLEHARPLQPETREFYELAVAARSLTLFYDVLPTLGTGDPARAVDVVSANLDTLGEDVDRLANAGSELAIVLQELLAVVREVLPLVRSAELERMGPLLRSALDRTLALRLKAPRSPHAYLLMLTAAPFCHDRAKAFAAVAQPPPPGPQQADLGLRRARARYELVATWAATAELAALDQAVGSLSPEIATKARRQLRADTAALRARLTGSKPSWQRAAQLYADLVGSPPRRDDAVLVNNLGVALAELGHTDRAVAMWEQAAALDEEQARVPRINLHVTRRGPTDYGALEQLLESDELTDELLVRTWLVHLADAARARRHHEAGLRRAIRHQQSSGHRPHEPSLRAGVHFAGTLQVGLGYSSRAKLQLTLNTARKVWLVRTPSPTAGGQNESPIKIR